MNFYKVNEGGVRRDDGVAVQIKHADYLEYRENTFAVDVNIGYDPRTRQIHVYGSEVTHWKEPDPSVSIDVVKRGEIIQNLQDALRLLKGNFVVE